MSVVMKALRAYDRSSCLRPGCSGVASPSTKGSVVNCSLCGLAFVPEILKDLKPGQRKHPLTAPLLLSQSSGVQQQLQMVSKGVETAFDWPPEHVQTDSQQRLEWEEAEIMLLSNGPHSESNQKTSYRTGGSSIRKGSGHTIGHVAPRGLYEVGLGKLYANLA
ncbi:hypothetical protein ABVK25_003766 [Lepraria finkii]|uniref:Uncharacterized protein n=1 Tax=Lepraria finkii TaxID=1340010 RepID=A0ABR4BJL4_9LECA